jgi:hypothetical protein
VALRDRPVGGTDGDEIPCLVGDFARLTVTAPELLGPYGETRWLYLYPAAAASSWILQYTPPRSDYYPYY